MLFNIKELVITLFVGIPYVVGYLGGLVTQLVAALTDYAFSLNLNIFIDQFGLIKQGFGTTLSVANLGFVIALILISFATILQVEQYSMNKLLGKLIVNAVLINFSLLIVGLILDFTHVLAAFFLQGGEVAGGLAETVNPQQFLIHPDGAITATGGEIWSEGFFAILASAYLMAWFTWIFAIALGAVAVMFVLRYVSLVVLIILMPIAWVSDIIPVKYFKDIGPKWWDSFLSQAFFLPVVSFFLLLVINIGRRIASTTGGLVTGDGGLVVGTDAGVGAVRESQAALSTIGFSELIPFFLQFVVLIFLIGAGLKMGVEVGGHSGKIAKDFADKAKKGINGGIRKTSVGSAKIGAAGAKMAYEKSGAARGVNQAKRAMADTIQSDTFKYLPGRNTLANKLIGSSKKSLEAQIKAERETLSHLTSPQQQERIGNQSTDLLSQGQKIARLQHLVEHGGVSTLAKRTPSGKLIKPEKVLEKIAPFVEAIKAANPDTPPEKIKELRALAASFPELSAEITGQSAREAINNADTKDLKDDVVKGNIDLFSQRQLNAIAKKSDASEVMINTALTEQLKDIKTDNRGLSLETIDQLQSVNKNLTEALEKEKNSTTQADKDAAGQNVQRLIQQRATIISDVNTEKLNPEERAIFKKIEGVAGSIGSLSSKSKKPKSKKPSTPKVRPRTDAENDELNNSPYGQ